jgi:putative hydrolase of the HAD superfamily
LAEAGAQGGGASGGGASGSGEGGTGRRIEAIVSDFGGVLTTPLMGSFLALQDEHGVSVEDFGKAMRAAAAAGDGEIPLFKLERGDITEPEFLEALRDGLEPLLGHRPHLHRFREVFFAALDPNEPMIELMREIKISGRRMAVLTNNVQEWEPLWRTMLPVDEIFEMVVDSGYVGYRKPEKQIYEITLERLGLPAEACLFIDDLEINIDAARELGFAAVHYREPDQAIAEIRAALA